MQTVLLLLALWVQQLLLLASPNGWLRGHLVQ
jgi:hypothetical protein